MRTSLWRLIARRSAYLFVAMVLAVSGLLFAERDPGARAYPGTLVKNDQSSNGNPDHGVPSGGHHNGPGDHCNDASGNDANKNKHCLAAQPSP